MCVFFSSFVVNVEGKKTTMSTKKKEVAIEAFAAERKLASAYVLRVEKKRINREEENGGDDDDDDV